MRPNLLMIRDFEPWTPAALAAIIALAPLPFGSVGVLASLLLFLALGIVGTWTHWRARSHGLRTPPLVIGLALIALLGLLQSSRGLRLELAEGASVFWAFGSVAPAASRSASVFWLCCAATVSTAAVLGTRTKARRIFFVGLVAAGLFQAIYGGQRFSANATQIWGREIAGDVGRLRGTFVNPDHLAFFLGLILPLLLASVWWRWRRRDSGDGLQWSLPFLVLAWVTLFIALALTGSRAGMLTALGVVGLQSLVVAALEKHWRAGLLVAGLAGLALSSLWWLSLEGQALGRLLGTSRFELQWSQRRAAYEAALELWSAAPLFGAGLGGFRQAFPLVQPAGLSGEWWHAHSDVLELAVTTGLLGVFILAVAGGLYCLRLLGALRSERSETRAAALAVLGSTVAACVHSLADFSLTLPANAVAFAVILGCGCAIGRGPGVFRETVSEESPVPG
ncbi:MAG: O-antigen ligase family protein [Acidobacteriota bacterium]